MTQRHERKEVFNLFQLQETAPGQGQLITKDMFMFMGIKNAHHDLVLEFMYNYLMPVSTDCDGTPREGDIPRGRGILHKEEDDNAEVSLSTDFSKYTPMTRDLADAKCPLAKDMPVKCSKFISPLFLIWQVRYMAGAVVQQMYTTAREVYNAQKERVKDDIERAVRKDAGVRTRQQEKSPKKTRTPAEEKVTDEIIAAMVKEAHTELAKKFHAAYPRSLKNAVLIDLEDGKYDGHLCKTLHVWEPPKAIVNKVGEQKLDTFCRQYVEGGGVMKNAKSIDGPAAGHFLTILGWDADKLIKAATPARTTARNTTPGQGAFKVIAGVLSLFASQHIKRAVVEEKGDDDDEEKEDDTIFSLAGSELESTVHTFDMYKKSLGAGEQEHMTSWAKDNLTLPTLEDRLTTRFGKIDDPNILRRERMVLLTSPPYGWNMSEHDHLPDTDEEHKVLYTLVCMRVTSVCRPRSHMLSQMCIDVVGEYRVVAEARTSCVSRHSASPCRSAQLLGRPTEGNRLVFALVSYVHSNVHVAVPFHLL